MSDDSHNQLYRKDIGTVISLSEDGNSLYTMSRDGVEINYCFLKEKDAKLFESYVKSDKFKEDIAARNNAQGSWINSNAISVRVIK